MSGSEQPGLPFAVADPVAEGFRHLPVRLDLSEQRQLAAEIRAVLAAAPPFQPRMPRSGRPFSVRMSNCGPLGWVSDRAGYRYQPHHPETGAPWPPMPTRLVDLWRGLCPGAADPDACLINLYGPGARMGLHQDRDEADFSQPVLSLSLGAAARFRLGAATRKGPTRALSLRSGDVVVLAGAARLAFHGIDRIEPGTGPELDLGPAARLNLTLRRARMP